MSRSNSRAPRWIKSRWPFVIGSKDPGYIATVAPISGGWLLFTFSTALPIILPKTEGRRRKSRPKGCNAPSVERVFTLNWKQRFRAQHQRNLARTQRNEWVCLRSSAPSWRLSAPANSTGFVGLDKLVLVAEVAGLDEIHNAPQIEQAVFQRRASERQPVLGLDLLHRARNLRAGIFDELRLVQNHRAEGEFLQFLQVAPEQRVIRHDDVVLRNLFAQIVSRRAAFEHEHLQVRREPFRLALPVVQHGRRADDERRLVIFFVLLLEPRQPGERLERFAEAHVVGKDAAELDVREVTEEIEAVLLIRAQVGLQSFRQFDGRNAPE